MDQFGTATDPGAAEGALLPSRADALERLAAALEARVGPVVLTGEPGAGKTWLLGRARDRMPAPWAWASVDLTPAVDAADFYRLVLHAVGIAGGSGLAADRAALVDFLTDRAADGERWVVVVDEAHAASDAVLDEVRVLGNRIGGPGALGGLVLCGLTSMVRRLASRTHAHLASRVAGHVHLMPVSVAELREWLPDLAPCAGLDRGEVERLHRDTRGNPRALRLALGRLGLAPPRPAVGPPRPSATHPAPVVPAAAAPAAGPAAARVAAVVSAPKPPRELAEGVVEVGWDSGEGPDEGAGAVASPTPDGPPTAETPDGLRAAPTGAAAAAEEVVEDHYAALQAWEEWARNQGRDPGTTAGPDPEAPAHDDPDDGDADERADRFAPAVGGPNVWVEGQQEFAPYSQLFTRLRQSHDPR